MAKIILEVNENEIPLNPLMQNMLKNMVLAYLKSAKKVPDDMNSIKIEIEL